jgi:polygalacturonase
MESFTGRVIFTGALTAALGLYLAAAPRVHDVQEFGAKRGDGVDDRAAIQRALDAAAMQALSVRTPSRKPDCMSVSCH